MLIVTHLQKTHAVQNWKKGYCTSEIKLSWSEKHKPYFGYLCYKMFYSATLTSCNLCLREYVKGHVKNAHMLILYFERFSFSYWISSI